MSENTVELFICPSCKKPSRRSGPPKTNLVKCENCGNLVPADLPKVDLVKPTEERYKKLEKEYRKSDSRLGQALAHGIREYMPDLSEFEEWLVKEHGIERVKTLTPGEKGQEFNRFMMHKDGIVLPSKISPIGTSKKEHREKPRPVEDGPELYCLYCGMKQKFPQSDFDKGVITCINCKHQTNIKELDEKMFERMKG